MVLTEILQKIRVQLQDKARSVFSSDDELKYALDRAVVQLSRFIPKYTIAEKVYPDDVTDETLTIASSTGTCAYFPIKFDSETITGKTRDTDYTINYRTGVVTEIGSNLADDDYTIEYTMDKRMCYIGDIVDDPINVKRVEYPANNTPATIVDFEYIGDCLQLKGEDTFSADKLIRIQYTKPYSAPTDEGEGDYPDNLDYPLIIGSSGIALLSKSEYYLQQVASKISDSATVAAEIGDLSAPSTDAAPPDAPSLTDIAIPDDLTLADVDTAPLDTDLPSAPSLSENASMPSVASLTDIAIPTDLTLGDVKAAPTDDTVPSSPSLSDSASMPSNVKLAALSPPTTLDLGNATWQGTNLDMPGNKPTAPTLSSATPPTIKDIMFAGNDYITPPSFSPSELTPPTIDDLSEPDAPSTSASAPTAPDLTGAGENLHDADLELTEMNTLINSAIAILTTGEGDDALDFANTVNAGDDVAGSYAKIAAARGELIAKFALAASGWIDSAKTQVAKYVSEVDSYRVEIQDYLGDVSKYAEAVKYQQVALQHNSVEIDKYQAEIQEEVMLLNEYVADVNLYNARVTAIINKYRSEVDSYLAQVNRDNAAVAKYASEVTSWRAEVEQYIGQLTAEVNNYRAQLEAQALIVQDNSSDVTNYAAQVNAYRAYVESYAAEIEDFKAEINSWMGKLASYNYQIVNEINNYKVQVDASTTISHNNVNIVNKYASEVTSYRAYVENFVADVEDYKNQISAWGGKLSSYNYQITNAISNFRAQIEASAAIVANNNHIVNKYASEVNSYSVEISEYSADVSKYQAQVQAKGAEIQGLSTAVKMYMEMYTAMQQRGSALISQFYQLIGANAEAPRAYTAFLQNT